MSRTFQTHVPCPGCNTTLELTGYDSVNVDRQPELLDAILDGSLQSFTCECGASLRGAPEFSYLHLSSGQWISVQPYEQIGSWQDHELQAQTLFDTALGSDAPDVAKELGEGVTPRVVFGWSAIREKILVAQNGLDDGTLECLKLQLFKTQGLMPETGQELRLIEIEDGVLRVAMINAADETMLTGFEVPRAAYDEVAAAPDAWAQVREPLLCGCFVDAQKLFLG